MSCASSLVSWDVDKMRGACADSGTGIELDEDVCAPFIPDKLIGKPLRHCRPPTKTALSSMECGSPHSSRLKSPPTGTLEYDMMDRNFVG